MSRSRFGHRQNHAGHESPGKGNADSRANAHPVERLGYFVVEGPVEVRQWAVDCDPYDH
jgi:hypothetical protein